ncbi:MAG TPA: HEAT repeat domain-containing protein [Gemmatimonadales bacterium]|nr:HEAT repeat domain-containing protein [Gemmatimonadales bacterium]
MNATHALGWALLHFLWQATALALLLAAGFALTRRASAQTRYALSLVTLVAMLILPLATGIGLYDRVAPVRAGQMEASLGSPSAASTSISPAASISSSPAPSPVATFSSHAPSLRDVVTPLVPWLVLAWVAGVVLLSLRFAHGWLNARRLRTTGTRSTAETLQRVLQRLAARMRVSRPVQLLESMLVEVPAVIGWLRPVILVPASALSGLTPQQLEVLLAHELAHVRRYDYIVNMIQCVIETLLFYHPAVWWVSRRAREERENCCDDLVVQLCGDRRLYASALVEMERLRPAAPRLALAATGGSLLSRVRRLVAPEALRREPLPRWPAGLAGVVAVTIALLAAGGDRLSGQPAQQVVITDTTRAAPDTVLRHPDPSQALAQRWDWARGQARRLGKRAYWIGYQVPRPEWLEHSVFIDRGSEVLGENIRMSGRMFGDFQGLMFRGVRLAPLTGTTDSDDIAVLFGFSLDRSGNPVLTHVHVASIYLPMDFRGRTLVWLGRGSDAQSIPLVEGLLSGSPPADLREDIVSAIGIHGSSNLVVPILIRFMNGREPTDIRAQAAEWLGFHPVSAAVAALSRAARTDQAADVRREAAEALSENQLPAALDSTIAIATGAPDPDARREAIEGLGEKSEDRALSTLVSVARTDRDEDVQREAVESLGEVPGGRGMNALRDIARNHPRADVRREAVETLGENLPSAEAIAALKPIASSDPDSDVRREAIETLGEIAPTAETVQFLTSIAKDDGDEDAQREAIETLAEIGELGLPAVVDIARTHRSTDIRRAAVATAAEHLPPAQALELLAQIARRDPDADVQREAVETLGELQDGRAYTLLVEFARTHPVSDVRREAVETLGETGRTDSVIAILDVVAGGSDDEDVAREAIETLAELDDPRALARVARIARRSSGSVDVRRAAIEKYGEHAPADSAVALLKGILASEAPEDIYDEVLETLEELEGGAGIPVLIDAARSHPNREVRADALRRLAESDDPRAQQVFDQTLRRP